MPPTFTERINVTRNFSDGSYQSIISFTGNVASVKLTTKPEYATTRQVIGTLIQFLGGISAQYDLYSGDDVISLELPETTKLIFFPTSYLSDLYNLRIDTATVGNFINASGTVSIPELILALPNKVIALESVTQDLITDEANLSVRVETLEANPTTSTWEDITGKPLAFPPTTHTHPISTIDGLEAALATIPSLSSVNAAISALQLSDTSQNSAIGTVQTDVSNLSLAVSILGNAPTASASLSYTLVTVNQALESNKKYLADVAGLVCTLPISPVIGDVISLSTGDFTLRVNHGNASHGTLNLSTPTEIGIGNGIILKAFADIDLVYVRANLWKSSFRSRITNNFQLPTQYPTAKILGSLSSLNLAPIYDTTLANIRNGVKAPTGAYQTNGYLGSGSSIGIRLSNSDPFILSQIRLWNGVGDEPLNSLATWRIDSLIVYRGINSTGVNLGTFTFTANNGIEQIRNIDNNVASQDYFFAFSRTGTQIGILELEVYGAVFLGGEVTAI